VLPTSENFLLARLPEPVLTALTPAFSEVDLRQRVILQEAGRAIEQVYFPLSGMVSLVAVTLAGESIETGIVGREGVVCGFLATGGLPSFAQAIVQIEGRALRIPAATVRAMCDVHLSLRTELDRYQAFVLMQAQQNVAWHALHSLEADFAAGCCSGARSSKATGLRSRRSSSPTCLAFAAQVCRLPPPNCRRMV